MEPQQAELFVFKSRTFTGADLKLIYEIVHGKRGISADTALWLSRFFGTSERFWMNLQLRFDLETEKERLAGVLEEEVSVLQRAV